jgi:hypothetical protein
MNWHEWLKELVGHKISITYGRSSAEGILEEVVGNVLVISSKHYDKPVLPKVLEERWYLKISRIDTITHEQDDCEKCHLESSVQSVA